MKRHGDEYRATRPDGDNPSSVQVMLNEYLSSRVYTRANDFPEKSDIITLVEYFKDMYFTHAMSWICEVCGYDYYSFGSRKTEESINPCVLWLEQILPQSNQEEEEESLTVYDELALKEYIGFPNKWFLDDGVSLSVQDDFEIGYSAKHERITIPIRDEFGRLVGVKGRTIHSDYASKDIDKFISIKKYPKTRVLYGLYQALSWIKELGEVIVVEAEKGVQQAASMDVKNVVGIGGHELSKFQVEMLERLRVRIVLALDKGLNREDIRKQRDKFIVSDLHCIWDKDNLLEDKNSPFDQGKQIWDRLYSECNYKIR